MTGGKEGQLINIDDRRKRGQLINIGDRRKERAAHKHR
jgi:hypothetical protein